MYCSRIASVNTYFYDDTGTFYLYRIESPQESKFQSGTSVVNPSGISLNHWSLLPNNVIGVAFFDEEDFVIVTSDLKIYILDLDYNVHVNGPGENILFVGSIVFS